MIVFAKAEAVPVDSLKKFNQPLTSMIRRLFEAISKNESHKKVESCSLVMSEDATWYSGSLSNLCRECPD